MAYQRDSGLPVRATWPGAGEGWDSYRPGGRFFIMGGAAAPTLPGRCPPSSRPSPPGEGEWFGWWGGGLDGPGWLDVEAVQGKQGILPAGGPVFYYGQSGSSAPPGRGPPSSRPSPLGEGEWFGRWLRVWRTRVVG